MAGAGTPSITRDLFKQHGLACRVYNYEAEYARINSAALSKGAAIKDELKERGYTDFSSFYMSCPKFSLRCWPSELRDLGGGVVLYFHFLVFCAAFLVLSFLVQLPAVVVYMGEENLDAWNWDAGGFKTDDIDNCGCIGSNNGVTGPNGTSFSQPDYGKSCGTWDLSWCQLGAAGPYTAEERGLWCCRKWCYASEKCPSTRADSPSLSNRFAAGAGLVRSYFACEQPQPDACGAGSGMDADVEFPRDDYKDRRDVPGGLLRRTGPGNLGPDRGDSPIIPPAYLAVLVLFCVAVVIAHQYQLRALALVDQGTTHPNDFAVFVEGLPLTANDEKQIAEFFKEHGVAGRSDTEIVKVVIGWESGEYRKYKREMMALKLKLVWAQATDNWRLLGKCLSFGTVEEVVKQLQALQEKIRTTLPDVAKSLKSSGTVVVVFRYQADARSCLQRWTSIPAKLFYTEADGCLGLGKGTSLPTFFHRQLRVSRAPNPSDINWEDLGVPFKERLMLFARTNGCVVLLIIASFFLVYLLERVKIWASGGGFGWSILPVLGITLTNVVLMMACKHFGKMEYHNTLAEQTASQSLKMAVALVTNTVGVMFFTNAQPKEWYSTLVDDIFLLMAVTGVFQPLAFLLDMKYYVLGFTLRRNLTDEKLEYWNQVIKETPKSADEVAALKKQKMQVAKQVEKMKEAFQPSELETTKRYAVAVRTFICSLLFSPLMPLLSLVGVLGLTIQYWVDKYMLLRWFKRPKEPHPGEQAVICLLFIRYTAAIFFPIAAYMFIHPSWREPGKLLTWLLFSLAIAVVYSVVPLSVARTLLCLRCLPGMRRLRFKIADESSDEQDYFKAQRLWTKEMKYHKSQFLYKMVPEAKNPEMLTPGAYAATTLSDVSGSYGVAAAALGDSNPAAAVHVRGHGHIAMDSTVTEPTDPSVPSGGGSSPVAGGGGGVPTSDPVVIIGDVSDTPEPTTPGDAGGGGGDGGADVGGGSGGGIAAVVPPAPVKKPVWQFDTGRGFSNFDDDCQAYIERKYQDKLGGGSSRVNVSTKGITVSIDFDMMTQKVSKRGQVRKIKREME